MIIVCKNEADHSKTEWWEGFEIGTTFEPVSTQSAATTTSTRFQHKSKYSTLLQHHHVTFTHHSVKVHLYITCVFTIVSQTLKYEFTNSMLKVNCKQCKAGREGNELAHSGEDSQLGIKHSCIILSDQFCL